VFKHGFKYKIVQVTLQFHSLIRFVEIQTYKLEDSNMNHCSKKANINIEKLGVYIKCKDPIITLRKLQNLFLHNCHAMLDS